MAGRPSKNTEQLVGHRTKAELQARKEVEDKLKSSDDLVSKVPNWLDKDAKRIYKFLIEQFESTGVLCNLDINMIAICSDALSKMKQAQKLIDEQGLIVDGQVNKAIIVYEKYEKIYLFNFSLPFLYDIFRRKQL